MRMKILRYAADRDNRFGDVRTTVSDLRRGVYIRFVPCLLRRMTSDKTQLFLIESAEGYWRNEQHYGICRRRRTAAALYPAADALSGTTPRNGEIDLKIKPYENHVSGALR